MERKIIYRVTLEARSRHYNGVYTYTSDRPADNQEEAIKEAFVIAPQIRCTWKVKETIAIGTEE